MANKVTENIYRPRIADELLQATLRRVGAVHIVGPKWCGKTTTAEQVAKSVIYFQDPDTRAANLRIASEKPSILLQGEKPLLLDEWQDAPKMWDAVRFAVDKNSETGQFILTGSTVINSNEVLHSGAGRFARLRMRPMSLFESGDSTATVSLLDVFLGDDISGSANHELKDIARLVARGGWPQATLPGHQNDRPAAYDYVEAIINTDISKVDGIEKNPNRVRLLMRSLARNESSKAAMTTLQADMATDERKISVNTISQYLNCLRSLYVLEEQEAWAPAVRSKVAMRTSPAWHYCDPSIACALLRLTPDKLMVDFNTFGLMFESLCIRDLRTYAEARDAAVFHYRDARNLECDAIIERADGTWGAVEIKLQNNQVDKAANNLSKIKESVQSQHGGQASFLMIITSTGFAYRRADGIYVVPIGCLKA